jgi:hypothetical protein
VWHCHVPFEPLEYQIRDIQLTLLAHHAQRKCFISF